MTISTEAQKAFGKTKNSFMIKTLNSEIVEDFLKMAKVIYGKPTANIIINAEKCPSP